MAKLKILSQYKPQEHGAKCSECPANGRVPCPPYHPTEPTYAVIGQEPTYWDVRKQMPLSVGSDYNIHNRARFDAQLPYKSYIDNVVSCQLDSLTKEEKGKAVECCKPRFINSLPPNIPALLEGQLPTKASQDFGFSKLGDYVGVPYYSLVLQRVCLATYSPSECGFGRKPALFAQFAAHIKKFARWLAGDYPDWVWPDVVTNLTHSEEDCLAILAKFKQLNACGADIETPRIEDTQELETKGKIIYNLGLGSYHHRLAFCLDTATATPRLLRATLDIYEDANIRKRTQNGLFDRRCMELYGSDLAGYGDEVMDAYRLCFPQIPSGLGDIAAHLTDAPRWKDEFKRGDVISRYVGFTEQALHEAAVRKANHVPDDDEVARAQSDGDVFTKADPVKRAVYCGRDSWVQDWLFELVIPLVAQEHRGLERYQFRMLDVEIAHGMWRHGYGYDEKRRAKIAKPREVELQNKLGDLQAMAKEAGYHNIKITEYKRKEAKVEDIPLNPNSVDQLHKLFAGIWEVVPLAYTDSGKASYDAGVIEALKEHDNKAVAQFATLLKQYREEYKLYSTYIAEPLTWSDGRLHAIWKAHHANTMRWGSEGPNMQNIPVWLRVLLTRTKEGLFTAKADYSALELRIVTLECGDERLLTAFLENRDLHTENAMLLWKLANKSLVTTDMRDFVKTFIYSVLYGAGINTIYAKFLEDEKFKDKRKEDIERAVEEWWKICPLMKKWQQDVLMKAKEDDCVIEPDSGHVLKCHGVIDASLLINFGIQTRGAKKTTTAIENIHKQLEEDEAVMGHQHDAIDMEGPNPMRLNKLLRESMVHWEHKYGRSMRYDIEVKVGGHNFGEMVEITDADSFALKFKDKPKNKLSPELREALELGFTTTANGVEAWRKRKWAIQQLAEASLFHL